VTTCTSSTVAACIGIAGDIDIATTATTTTVTTTSDRIQPCQLPVAAKLIPDIAPLLMYRYAATTNAAATAVEISASTTALLHFRLLSCGGAGRLQQSHTLTLTLALAVAVAVALACTQTGTVRANQSVPADTCHGVGGWGATARMIAAAAAAATTAVDAVATHSGCWPIVVTVAVVVLEVGLGL